MAAEPHSGLLGAAALLCGLGLMAGCAGAPSDASPSVDYVTGDLGEAVAAARADCVATCDVELACIGGGDVARATCEAACEARFDPARFVDTPSARTCLFHEQAEMACFAELTCEAMQGWFAADDGGAVACAAADAAAIAACEDHPF